MSFFRASAWASLAVLFACGGNVVVVDDGGGGTGSGASGPAGPGSGPSGPGSSVSGPGVTTGGMTTCEKVCAVAGPCFMGNCLGECASLYLPGCEAQTDAFLLCAIASLPSGACELPPGVCEAEAAAYEQCANGGSCSNSSCAFEVCTCSASCFGGTLVADCDSFGASTCDCYFNDEYFGTCDGQSCVVDQSCCYALAMGQPD